MISKQTKAMVGIILLTVPTIIYGGYFLLIYVSGIQAFTFTYFQASMFRAGHAHAGVLTILSMLLQIFIDSVSTNKIMLKLLRASFPIATLLISLGFFLSAVGKAVVKPNQFINMVYVGAVILAIATVFLGVQLLRTQKKITL